MRVGGELEEGRGNTWVVVGNRDKVGVAHGS